MAPLPFPNLHSAAWLHFGSCRLLRSQEAVAAFWFRSQLAEGASGALPSTGVAVAWSSASAIVGQTWHNGLIDSR